MDLGLLCLEGGGEVGGVGGWGGVRIGTTSSFLQSLHISSSSHKKANKVKVLNIICSIILLSLALTVYFYFYFFFKVKHHINKNGFVLLLPQIMFPW